MKRILSFLLAVKNQISMDNKVVPVIAKKEDDESASNHSSKWSDLCVDEFENGGYFAQGNTPVESDDDYLSSSFSSSSDESSSEAASDNGVKRPSM